MSEIIVRSNFRDGLSYSIIKDGAFYKTCVNNRQSNFNITFKTNNIAHAEKEIVNMIESGTAYSSLPNT